jgi:putative heme-binding domain-containing protein
LAGAHVVTPGDPYSSVLYYRISTMGQGRMPLIGSRLVDTGGVRLIHDWVKQLPRDLSEDKAESAEADRLRASNAEASSRIRIGSAVFSLDESRAAIDHLLASVNGALLLASTRSPANVLDQPSRDLIEKAASHSSFQVRDLFERFLPEEKRPKKLGPNLKPEDILALKGDPAKGRKLFFNEAGVQCARCHRIEGDGRDFGPDLSKIGAKYDRRGILENILSPSKTMEPDFITYRLEAKNDLEYSGLLIKRTEEEIVLKDANGQLFRVPRNEVKSLQPQQLSAMPELLLQSMTAGEAADLLEFLTSLR